MRVLIADDEPEVITLLQKSLQEWGFEAVTCRSGDEAWEVLKEHDCPPIAILDWMMPGKDGLELARLVRQKESDDYVYIIFLTSKDRSEDVISALEAGANSYVKKPVNLRELHSYINTGVMLIHYIQGRKQFSDNLKEKITKLYEAMKIMKGSITDLASATTIINQKIKDLSGSYDHFLDMLNTFIEIISEVSTKLAEMKTLSGQINIISINAGIESTRIKGSSGKGFAAVANEIRQLALVLKDYTKGIVSELNKLEDSRTEIFGSKDVIHEDVRKTEELFNVQRAEFDKLDAKMKNLSEELRVLHQLSLDEDVKFGMKVEKKELEVEESSSSDEIELF